MTTLLRAPWWELYDDPVLSGLAEEVAAANQNLAAAEARFRQARTLVWQARSNWFPTAVVGVSFARSRVSATLRGGQGFGTGTISSDFTLPGQHLVGARPVGEDPAAGRVGDGGAQSSAADLANTRLSLQAELAVDYFQLRTLDADIRLLEDTARSYERSLKLTENRHENGIASGADIAQAQTQLETTRAQAIDLGVQRAALEHAIAVLMGSRPPTSRSRRPSWRPSRRSSRSACRPTCSSGGPTSPRPSATWRRPMRRSASPCRRTTRRSR